MSLPRAFARTCVSWIPSQRPNIISYPTAKRLFSSLSRSECPYRILGVPRESTYSAVKRAFLQMATSHHPDVLSASNRPDLSEEELETLRSKSVDIFVKSRLAFEAIVEVGGGMSALRSEVEGMSKDITMSDDEFDAWFHSETGRNLPSFSLRIDPAVMREVAEMNDEVSHGLDRDGGMWQLASMVSDQVKKGKDAASMLRLEAGAISDDDSSGRVKSVRDGHAFGATGRRRRRS